VIDMNPMRRLKSLISKLLSHKPVKYLTGSGKAPTHSRDALPQTDGAAFSAPDAGAGLMLLPPVSPRPHYQELADLMAHDERTFGNREPVRAAIDYELDT
tara:strand:+ start:2334 stop:2633 length:300 start_codon:yes stop_codon:yes gene_type:complete